MSCCVCPCRLWAAALGGSHKCYQEAETFLFGVQVLEAILDDDQDMQDMYLARRAAMAEMIAPDPDDSADPALALLPSVSVSSVAETALTQALQTVASAQTVSPDSPQYLVSKHAGQSWFNQRPAQDQGQDQEDESSVDTMQHPVEMAVPDQASFLLPGLHTFLHAIPCTH